MRKQSVLPLVLIGAGVALYMFKKSQATAAPVHGMGEHSMLPGMGSWLSKKTKQVKKSVHAVSKAVTKPIQNLNIKDAAVFAAGGGIVQAAKMGVTSFKALPSGAKAVLTGGVTALGVTKLVQKVMPGKRAPAAKPKAGQKVEYQDENGNVITKAEYDRRQGLYEQQSACMAQGKSWTGSNCIAQAGAQNQAVSDPGPSSSGQSFTDPNMYAPQSSGGGGGGGAPSSSDYYQGGASDASAMPPADATPAPTSVDEVAPAAPPGKLNPLVAVAAFAAVPLVLGLTGAK